MQNQVICLEIGRYRGDAPPGSVAPENSQSRIKKNQPEREDYAH